MRGLSALGHAIAFAVAAATVPHALWAQEIHAGGTVQTYVLSQDSEVRLRSVRLYAVPFGGSASIGSWATVGVSGAFAATRARFSSGVEASASGLVDTRMTLLARLGRWWVTSSAVLPTGKVVATDEEAVAVGILSADLLPFAVRQWGTGGGVSGEGGVGFRVGETSARLSLGAEMMAGSTPLSGTIVYRPGPQFRVRMGLESAVGAAGMFSFLGGVQYFQPDSYDGRDLFRSGLRVDAMTSFAFPVGGRESALLYGGVYHGGGGVVDAEGRLAMGQDNPLSGVSDRPARQLFKVGGEMHITRGRLGVAPHGEVRVLRSDGGGQGWLASVGTRAEFGAIRRGPNMQLKVEPALGIRYGRLLAPEGASSTVLGWEAGVTLRWP